eukprot:11599923-Prorocentrum_lima.AAC.1
MLHDLVPTRLSGRIVESTQSMLVPGACFNTKTGISRLNWFRKQCQATPKVGLSPGVGKTA